MANAHPKNDIYIGRGRLVQGHLSEPQTKDHQQRDKPREKWNIFFAVAVPKADPSNAVAQQTMMNTAWAGYQNVANVAAEIRKGMMDPNAKFSWKIEDGDAPANANKEGFAGCWIYKFSTTILDLPKTCDRNNQPMDKALIKRGYWVDVKGTTAINGNTDDTASIYMNPVWVRFLDVDQEILGGQSAEEAFAGMPPVSTGAPIPAPASPPGGTQITPPPAATPAPPPPAVAHHGVPSVAYTPPTAGAPAAPAAPVSPPPVHVPAVPSPATASLTSPPPGVTPQPGFANGPATPAPVTPPPAPVAPVQLTAAQIAAQYGVQHYPGHRYDPTAHAYVPDPTSV